jgi:hypothetical protein
MDGRTSHVDTLLVAQNFLLWVPLNFMLLTVRGDLGDLLVVAARV